MKYGGEAHKLKLIEKKCISEYERNIKFLGCLNFSYSKIRDKDLKRIKYNVKFAGLSFNFYKKRKTKGRKFSLLKFDKEKQLFALIYSKAIRSIFSKNDRAKTLILGSSTARCSYIEDENSINLGIDAQDLYYSYELFKKFRYQIPNLKNLVIYYDIFSPGNDLDISPCHQYVTAFYKAFFDIPYKNKLIAIRSNMIALENKIYDFKGYINKNLDSVPKDVMPIVHGGLWTEAELKGWAKAELKLANKGNMNKYLNALIEEAGDLNIYFVLAPRNPLALEVYPDTNEIFKSFFDMLKKHENRKIKVINCFRDFKQEDFLDLLHLNMNGAKRLTDIINKNLEM